jgi:hypothetical protein
MSTMLVARVTLALSMVLVGSPAIAGQMTVGDLQMICSGTDAESRAACRFYILGVTEGVGLAAGDTPNAYCIAPGTSSIALAEAVEAVLKDDLSVFPKDRELAASGFVSAVVFRAFPCGRQQN